MSFVDRLLVPDAKSSASTSAVRRPRVAASSAAPVPVAPPGGRTPLYPRAERESVSWAQGDAGRELCTAAPPMTSTSKLPACRRASWAARGAGAAWTSSQACGVVALARSSGSGVKYAAAPATPTPPAASSARRVAILERGSREVQATQPPWSWTSTARCGRSHSASCMAQPAAASPGWRRG